MKKISCPRFLVIPVHCIYLTTGYGIFIQNSAQLYKKKQHFYVFVFKINIETGEN